MKEVVYLEQFKAFGLPKKEVDDAVNEGIIVDYGLAANAYDLLFCDKPSDKAPTVGLVFGEQKDFYAADWDYVRSLAKAGVNIRFLDYENAVRQLEKCDALVLPGGKFSIPESFYEDASEEDKTPSCTCCAYLLCIEKAQQSDLPILGICTGAQVVGGWFGMKMYHSGESRDSYTLEHDCEKPEAHVVNIRKNSALSKLFSGLQSVKVNSQHREFMVADEKNPQLRIYAAAEDGVPEAWGSDEKHILCVQWHPENRAVLGDAIMQRIFNWVAEQAKGYQKRHSC